MIRSTQTHEAELITLHISHTDERVLESSAIARVTRVSSDVYPAEPSQQGMVKQRLALLLRQGKRLPSDRRIIFDMRRLAPWDDHCCNYTAVHPKEDMAEQFQVADMRWVETSREDDDAIDPVLAKLRASVEALRAGKDGILACAVLEALDLRMLNVHGQVRLCELRSVF
tara:strand:- start:4396 stop:4905 length:510 start_codon:yes stop_codon:yes gene_type:complete